MWLGRSDSLGDCGRLDSAADTQLAQDVGYVDARRLLRDVQLGADLPVRETGGDESQDLRFARGQPQLDGPPLAEGVDGPCVQVDAGAAGDRLDVLDERL